MGGISQPIRSILEKLTSIRVTNNDNRIVDLYARIWNNQVEQLRAGDDSYIIPDIACFVEIITPVTFDVIGTGYRSADLGVRLHLVHQFYNQESTYEQDLIIFDLRDKIVEELSQWQPLLCSPLNCISEEQDYDHDNLYHYVLDFVCNFIDSKGSKYDPEKGNFTCDSVDLDLVVENGINRPLEVQEADCEFVIPTNQHY